MPLKRGLGKLAFRPGAKALSFQTQIQGHKCPCSLQMISNAIALACSLQMISNAIARALQYHDFGECQVPRLSGLILFEPRVG